MARSRRDWRRPKPVWFPKQAARDAFLSMPEDVFHMICDHLDFPDILQLVCTNSHFARFGRSLLLHKDLTTKEPHALCWACGQGDLALAEKCLKMGHDPNQSDASNEDDRNWLRIYKGEMEHHFWPPENLYITFSVLAQAIMGDRTEMLCLLHRYGTDIPPLETAFSRMDFDCVKILLDWGASLEDLTSTTAKGPELYRSVTYYLFQNQSSTQKSQDIMSLLINHGIDIGFGRQFENLRTPKLYLDLDKDSQGTDLFHQAVIHGTTELFDFLSTLGPILT
ncbi:hypothetical protein CMUS01_12578 [Colletotrichum musicola]|uniref:F-box domain-containing protein n=1 Tax=Colletotrichum musicola TaxID=2175873 RepID=A0A8H6JLF1_9PEZI|nr:hypothetical protein CMUS01_12578 [Colletotrichum musicola]